MRLRRYVAHDDPRVARANLIALVLAWNTPFYPLYLRWAAGPEAWPWGWLTLASLPVFASIPALTRARPLVGRVALALAGTANTLFCTWLLGESSGTELFLLPCVLLPGLILRRAEVAALLPLLALPIAAYYGLHDHYPAPPHPWSALASAGMLALNVGSVGCLTAFFAWLAATSEPQHTLHGGSRHQPER